MDRDKFAQDFLAEAKARGKTKDEAITGLNQALVLYDKDHASMATPKQEEKEGSFLSKALGTIGKFSKIAQYGTTAIGAGNLSRDTKAIGEANSAAFKRSQELTNQAKKETDPEKKKALVDEAREIMRGAEKATEILEQDITNYQTAANIGDREMGMSNLEFAARRGGAAALEAGSLMIPGPGTMATTAGGRITQAGFKGAASGLLSSSAEAVSEEDDLKEAAKSIGKGTLFSALFAAGAAGLGELRNIGKYGNKSKKALEKREKALEKYKEQIKDNKVAQQTIKQHGGLEEMRKTALKEGIDINSTKGLEKQLKQYSPKFESEVTEILSKNSKTGLSFNDALTKSLESIDEAYGAVDPQRAETMKAFLIDNYKNTQPLQTPESFNRLRKDLDRVTRGKPLDTISAMKTEAQKFLVTNMRGEMYHKIPELTKPMTKYATMATMLDVMKKDKSVSLLGNLIGAGSTPFAIGAATGNVPTGLATGAAAGVASYGKNIASSPQAQRAIANIMAQRAIQKPVATQVPNVLTSLIGKIPSNLD